MTTPSPPAAIRSAPGGFPARRVAEALFPGSTIHYVDRYEAMADVLDTLADQRPSTCGAYVTRYLMGPLGHTVHNGVSTTREDYLAFLAGTVMEISEEAPAEDVRAAVRRLGLSDAAAVDQFGEAYYAWPLRVSSDPAAAGTSPTGTARIVAESSGGSLVTLPIPARTADGQVLLDGPAWDGLLDVIESHLTEWRVHVIANYQSDQLFDPVSDAYNSATLTAPDPAAVVPLDGWGVGHFAGVGAFWRTADGRRWVLLLDTYRSRGFSRYEPQLAELVRRALVRDDGREGGLLLVLPRQHIEGARTAVEGLGLEIRMWGNGSPEPEGWTWELGR